MIACGYKLYTDLTSVAKCNSNKSDAAGTMHCRRLSEVTNRLEIGAMAALWAAFLCHMCEVETVKSQAAHHVGVRTECQCTASSMLLQ